MFVVSFRYIPEIKRLTRSSLLQANQRVEEFKTQLKELKIKLKAAEKRAVIAEKTVKIFTKEMDKREGADRMLMFLRIGTTFQRSLTNDCLYSRLPVEREGEIQIHLRRSGFHVLGVDGILKRREEIFA